ncbi:hypothetical protein SSX86_013264 [Deinandra increscens subsp. villosa]|uniref:Peptidase S10, serine carboxypeptidase, Alpha/Beta hydrolase fold protein n=1 Tax=Deinandra increscens subsp. villosa TaxID=3103831 RepID=A0AAP0GZJ8_9ASTR
MQRAKYLAPMSIAVLVTALLFVVSSTPAASQTIVETLPGYPGPLPFKLETGYIGVGENETVQLFYYFVESEGNPSTDPLLIGVPGGPGCSMVTALFFQIGPMRIQIGNYTDNVPTLEHDQYAWSQIANVVYIDAPTLTGFSYTTTPEANRSSDTLSSAQLAEFTRKFVIAHPKFVENPMYIIGWSYAGIVLPMMTEKLYEGNDEGIEPILNLKGYILANPLTDKSGDVNSRLKFFYSSGLITEELYESTRKSCRGNYADADSNNLRCMSNIDEVNKRISKINIQGTLDTNCYSTTNFVKSASPHSERSQRSPNVNPIEMVTTKSVAADTDITCMEDILAYAATWVNDESVKKALNVRKGTVETLTWCNPGMRFTYGETSMPLYEFNISTSVPYHKKLSNRNTRALVYSGDHDVLCPYIGTLDWINSLNLRVTDSNWDAWYFNGQTAGYKTSYARKKFSLTFATVKGAGHIPQLYKRGECYEMAKKWLADTPF